MPPPPDTAALTIHEFADRLTGREYGGEITSAEEAQAKAAGFVVVFGYSDDGVELRGAINDELGAYGGKAFNVGPLGLVADWDDVDKSDEEEVTAHVERKRLGFREIEALWCAEPGYSWTYRTEIPHATFEVVEDGEPYCRGLVFRLTDTTPAPTRAQESV